MEEKNTNYNNLFDDRELENEKYIDEKDIKVIVSKEKEKEIDNNINKILDSIKIEYED